MFIVGQTFAHLARPLIYVITKPFVCVIIKYFMQIKTNICGYLKRKLTSKEKIKINFTEKQNKSDVSENVRNTLSFCFLLQNWHMNFTLQLQRNITQFFHTHFPLMRTMSRSVFSLNLCGFYIKDKRIACYSNLTTGIKNKIQCLCFYPDYNSLRLSCTI